MNRQMLIDLLAAGRVANLPSVVSNVVFGASFIIWWVDFEALNLFWPALAGCFLYLGGCFLNDWYDRPWDQKNKPERALPAGRLFPPGVLFLALAFLLAGLVCSFLQAVPAGWVAVGIVLAVALYTWIHKKSTLGVIPMGLCRGGLYFLGLTSQAIPEIIPKGVGFWKGPSLISSFPGLVFPALGLAAFVAGLSLLARYEARGIVDPWKKWLAMVLLLLPSVTVSFLGFSAVLIALVGFGAIVLWGHRLLRQSIGRGVSFFLASICLVDGIPLAMMAFGSIGVPLTPNYWPFLGVSALAFLLALALQRIAPAT